MRWLWIDRIIEYEPDRRLVAIKNISLAEDVLHDHFAAEDGRPAQPVMPASLLIEGMAQTSGILVGAVHAFREKVLLAKISTARFDLDVTAGDCVRYEATLERIDDAGAQTRGVVSRREPTADAGTWDSIGVVDLLFSHLDRNRAGLAFSEDNFVFSDNFNTILGASSPPALVERFQSDAGREPR